MSSAYVYDSVPRRNIPTMWDVCTYDLPFLQASEKQISNSRNSTGKERDTETGLDYFGARYYGSSMGRFTSPDEPLLDQEPHNPQSWNLYNYVRNNPLRFSDPNGSECVSDGSGGWKYSGSGETCDDVDKSEKQQREDPKNHANVTVDGCAGEGAADCLSFEVAQRTTTANISGVVRHGVEGAMTAEAIWNLPSLFRSGFSLLKSLKAARTEWKLGGFKTAQKWANQMLKRGWTPEQITEAIEGGQQFPAPNNVNPANTATRYVHPTTGRSVVVDDVTKEVLHVGGDGFDY